MDVPGAYAARIAAAGTDCRVLRACLSGLAESGGAAHLGLIRGYTGHGDARVQIAALLAWLRLVPNDKDDIAEHVLRSQHRRVRKLFPSFVRLGAYVPIDVAVSRMHEHGDYEQILSFARGSSWTLLEVVATIAGETDGNANLRQRLGRELEACTNRGALGYTRPNARQRAFLMQETVQQTLLALLEDVPETQRRLARSLEIQ